MQENVIITGNIVDGTASSTTVLVGQAIQGRITTGGKGAAGEKGDAGTTDYNGLINTPTLGTAASTASTDYATAAQGTKADTATQPADIADLETTTQLNTRDTANRSRINHTGTQAQSTVTNLVSDLASKQASGDYATNTALSTKADTTYVDSENNAQDTLIAANTAKRSYPSADETKLAGIEAGATADQDLSGKQDVLVSGTSIKTINSTSLLGSGDIVVAGSGLANVVDDLTPELGGDLDLNSKGIKLGTSRLTAGSTDPNYGINGIVLKPATNSALAEMLTPGPFLFTSNAGDGTGNWEPYFILQADGGITFANSFQGLAADRIAHFKMTGGAKFSSDNKSVGTTIKSDNTTVNRTLQLPDADGTVATQEYVAANPGSGGINATNLTTTAAPTTVTINSDTGTDAVIAATDATNAGLLLPAEKTKLASTSGINTGDQDLSGKANSSHTHVATTDLTATGTKSSATYLRGDNTWATPTGGGDVTLTGTQTLTNKTITAPVLSGTLTGTYTIGGTPTFPSTVVSTTGTQTLTNKRITPRAANTTTGTTITPVGDLSDIYFVTALASAATIANPSGAPTNGQRLLLRIKDNGTARALTFGPIYRVFGTPLPITTVAGKITYIGCIFNSADTKWDVIAVTVEA